jgi:pyruvate-formate lyase-activating enzyme
VALSTPWRVHAVDPRSRANGPGTRFVIWSQGCTLGCAGCFNPETHPPDVQLGADVEPRASVQHGTAVSYGVNVQGGVDVQAGVNVQAGTNVGLVWGLWGLRQVCSRRRMRAAGQPRSSPPSWLRRLATSTA